MRSIFHYLLFSTALAIVAASFSASSTAKDIKVVTEYLAPFQIKNHDGSLGGFATEIVNRLFDITNETSDIRVLPWARAYRIGLSRPNTLIYSMAKTSARYDKFHWIGKVKSERFFVWGLRSKFSQPVNSIEQLKKYRVAVSKSYNSADYVKNNGYRNIHYTTRDQQSLGMLFKGRTDILVSSELVLKQLTMSAEFDFSQLIKLADVPELNNDLAIAYSQSSDIELVQRFRLAYKHLEDSGELQRLRDRWQVYDDLPIMSDPIKK